MKKGRLCSIDPLQPSNSDSSPLAPLDIPPSPPLTTSDGGFQSLHFNSDASPAYDTNSDCGSLGLEQCSTLGSTCETTLPPSDDSSPKQASEDGEDQQRHIDDFGASGLANSYESWNDFDSEEAEHCSEQEELSSGGVLVLQSREEDDDPKEEAPEEYNPYQDLPRQCLYSPPEFPITASPYPYDNNVPWDQCYSFECARRHLANTWEDHCQQKMRECNTAFSGIKEGVVLVRLLVYEAWRLERRHLVHKLVAKRNQMRGKAIDLATSCFCVKEAADKTFEAFHPQMLKDLDAKWSNILNTSTREVYADGNPYDTVRRLANMFIFLEGKQTEYYSPDNPDLCARVAQQQYIIDYIKAQPSGSLFLPPAPLASARTPPIAIPQ